jgi:ribosomal protein L29
MDTFKDIAGKNTDELEALVLETRELLRTIRFDRFTKEVKDNRLQRNTRRYLARLLTAIHAKK